MSLPPFLALMHKYVPKHQISPIKHPSIPRCLTTVPQPVPKRNLDRQRSSASSFTFKYERTLLWNNTLFVLNNTIIHSLVFILEGRAWQEPEPSHVTGMALAHCILGKLLGVVCHCFPPPLDVPTLAARCLRPQRKVELWARKMPGSNFA